MPVYKRVVTEGITSETRAIISAPRTLRQVREHKKALRAFVKQQNQLNTFDGRVAQLEQFCRTMSDRTRGMTRNGEKDQMEITPAFGSPVWYADTILRGISAVRLALARDQVQLALSEAVEVGALATEAQAKFGPWKDVLLHEARTQKNRELSSRGRAAQRAKAAERDSDVIPAARRYRTRHPEVTREHSTRAMAKAIAGISR